MKMKGRITVAQISNSESISESLIVDSASSSTSTSFDLKRAHLRVMEYLNREVAHTALSRAESKMPREYKNSSTYLLGGAPREYTRQFFSMYEHRLNMLKPRVDREAMRKWGHNTREVNGKFIQRKEKILDIASGEVCWVSGTIFSDMKHKLNIFQDVERGEDDMLPTAPEKYVDAEHGASVMIEDESGRAVLRNDELLATTGLVTGCVVAVLGIEVQAGVFEIMEVVYPTPAPQNQPIEQLDGAGDEWVAFVSGMQFDKETSMDLRPMLLSQWLAGELGGSTDSEMASKVARLVVLGNSVAQIEPERNTDFQTTNNFGSKNTSRFSSESVVLFNSWLSEVLATVPVTVLPGATDPCELCLPQQPMHRSLFGVNKPFLQSDHLASVSNPSWLETAGGCRIVAASGQTIDDICKYKVGEPTGSQILDVMAQTMRWQNIAPTAPDTLYCYPYNDRDPFTLDETPNVYVVGNQVESGARELKLSCGKVQLVSVGAFSKTGDVVLVNTRTLETKTVKFEL